MKPSTVINAGPVSKKEKIKKKPNNFNIMIQKALPIILFFLVWEAFGRINQDFNWINPLFLPPPTLILQDGWILAQTGIITSSIIASTLRILVGFGLGCIFAIAVGVIMSQFKVVENWVAPIINLVGPIPALALLPLFIIWFGIGEFPKILLIAWSTFIPVFIYTLDGLKSVNSTLVRSALSLGANQRQIFTRVIIPSAIPNILVGIEVSLGLSFSALVVSEMMGAETGLGYIIVDARNYFKISNMFVAIILIGIEYSIFAYLIKKIKERILFWRQGGANEAIEG
ncbi:ABC transporter permease [Gracilibacillus massiliensis]|uniref:ABC transporter permease n=1 Tax=Gracilibacillus massiliensis TaxID=1564956 RepID=UPI00071D33FA|nr:ABC transporter permease [Gracilibacillus massiliensis]